MNKNECIKELKFWCQKVLPLVYDDSLSYYELLCKITYKLNEVIKNVNSIDDEIYNTVIEWLNENLNIVLSDYLGGIYSVKMFGASGDGTTDDTTAILNTINSMKNGGILYFPPGTYIISKTIEIPRENKVSISFNNAVLKQSTTLYPMIKFATTQDINYPQQISGTGVIDMDNKGGYGLQCTNYSTYAIIKDIQVRNCSNGIGVLIGDYISGKAVSLQLTLDNVYIYGKDSRDDGIGLYVNAYDCAFKNMYLYLCKTGGVTKHGGHTFSNIHIWAHTYTEYSDNEFMETTGLDLTGTSFFDMLYLDSLYAGIKTNGYDQYISKIHYTSDIKQHFDSDEIIARVVEKDVYERVIISSGLFYNPQTNYKCCVFYTKNDDTIYSVTANKLCVVTCNKKDSRYWIPFDEANNLPNNNNSCVIFPRGTLQNDKYYLLGYIKLSNADDFTLNIYEKSTFLVSIKCRVTPSGLSEVNATLKYPTEESTKHIYYGESVTFNNINYLPIYVKFDNTSDGSFMCNVSNNYDTGFYPYYVKSIDYTETKDSDIGLTEINW